MPARHHRGFRFRISIIALGLMVSILSGSPAAASDWAVTPLAHQDRPFRIGYYEGGPYANYPMTLKAIVKGLTEMGWMAPLPLPGFSSAEDSRALWDYLAAHVQSPYIRFERAAYWSANWEPETRQKSRADCLAYLSGDQKVDLMIAMGTWAGQDLANDRHQVPTIVCSSSDAVAADIVKSIKDSGLDHLHARLDPTIAERQIRLFHDFVPFKTLGLAYEDSSAGRTYAAVASVEKMAKEFDFEIVRCFTQDEVPDKAAAEESVRKCYTFLAPRVDALYITLQSGVTMENMPHLLAPLLAHKVPTFSQQSAWEVEYGALMSFSVAEYQYVGRFHAETAARIFNGALPRQLDQVFHDPKRVTLNLATARRIGYQIPEDLLAVADVIHETIKTLEKE